MFIFSFLSRKWYYLIIINIIYKVVDLQKFTMWTINLNSSSGVKSSQKTYISHKVMNFIHMHIDLEPKYARPANLPARCSPIPHNSQSAAITQASQKSRSRIASSYMIPEIKPIYIRNKKLWEPLMRVSYDGWFDEAAPLVLILDASRDCSCYRYSTRPPEMMYLARPKESVELHACCSLETTAAVAIIWVASLLSASIYRRPLPAIAATSRGGWFVACLLAC